MPTFGNTNVEATPASRDIGPHVGYFQMNNENGEVTKITAYIGAAAGTISAKACIYSNVAGLPSALLGASAEVTGITTSLGWVEFTFSPSVSVSALTYYW